MYIKKLEWDEIIYGCDNYHAFTISCDGFLYRIWCGLNIVILYDCSYYFSWQIGACGACSPAGMCFLSFFSSTLYIVYDCIQIQFSQLWDNWIHLFILYQYGQSFHCRLFPSITFKIVKTPSIPRWFETVGLKTRKLE